MACSLRQNNQLVIFDEFLSCPIKKNKVREYILCTSKVHKSCSKLFSFPFLRQCGLARIFFSVALRIVILMNSCLVPLIKGKKERLGNIYCAHQKYTHSTYI